VAIKRGAKVNVFLSASIPLPDRHPQFYETADVVAIREAIKGLILVLIERRGRLTFGGHPAITPLVRLLFNQANVSPREHVTLYQSEFFRRDFPPENSTFERVFLTPAVNDDREESLAAMRKHMLTGCNFDGAVFVGGMEGVITEYLLFRELNPNVPAYPIPSTGAAAKIVYEQYGYQGRVDLNDLTYPTLFRRLFPREERLL